jgi:hypothetical protein
LAGFELKVNKSGSQQEAELRASLTYNEPENCATHDKDGTDGPTGLLFDNLGAVDDELMADGGSEDELPVSGSLSMVVGEQHIGPMTKTSTTRSSK